MDFILASLLLAVIIGFVWLQLVRFIWRARGVPDGTPGSREPQP